MTMAGCPRAVVCHITTIHSPFDDRIFHKECLSLVEAGYEVHLVAPHTRDEQVRGVHIHALPAPRNRLTRILFQPWRAYRIVRTMRPRPVLCHFHDPEFLPAGQVLRWRGIKVVFDVHENVAGTLRHKAYLPRVLRRPVAALYRMAERVLSRGMASVHVLDTIAAEYREPRVVVRNLPKLAPLTAVCDRAPGGRPRLVYVGGITRERGAMTMIRLAEELHQRGADFEMALVGAVSDAALEHEMRDAIQQAGLADRLRLPGFVPFEQAQAEVAAADIGLCLLEPVPNYLNSLPIKVFEYMRFGLPVVASDFECWRPYVTETGAGVQVDGHTIAAVADAVQRLLDRPDERQRMGRRGKAVVEAELSWDREQEKLRDFYRRLIADAPGACAANERMDRQP